MEWITVVAVVVIVAGLVCAALVGVAAFDLRRHLNRAVDGVVGRQGQTNRKLAEDLRAAQARIEELQRAQRKMAAEIADLYDRVTDERSGGRRGERGERWLN